MKARVSSGCRCGCALSRSFRGRTRASSRKSVGRASCAWSEPKVPEPSLWRRSRLRSLRGVGGVQFLPGLEGPGVHVLNPGRVAEHHRIDAANVFQAKCVAEL